MHCLIADHKRPSSAFPLNPLCQRSENASRSCPLINRRDRMQNRAGWLRFLERLMTDLRAHDRFAQRPGSRP
jgi:hypothetical protein